MNEDEQKLWVKIQNFEINKKGVAFTFSQRLAKENNLTHEFAKEIVEEYKKFIFLCCISNKMVSPSYYVDLAWHLHLTYTKSYWNEMCRDILGKEIHHMPTEGGKSEDLKFKGFYDYTLAFYKEKFGNEPVTKVWKNKPVTITHTNLQLVKSFKTGFLKYIKLNFKYLIILALPLLLFSCENELSILPWIFFGFIFFIILLYALFATNKERTHNNSSDSSSSGGSCSSSTLTYGDSNSDSDSSSDGGSDGSGDGGGDGGSSCGGGCGGGGGD